MKCPKVVLAVLLLLIQLLNAETELMVSAASSLKNVFTEIGAGFEKEHSGTKVLFNFAASGQLQAQIEMGAPVDVFASASQKEIKAMVEKKLIDAKNVQNFAQNALVLIKSSSNKIQIKDLSDLKKKEIQKIAISNKTSVPAGKYAYQSLEYYKLAKDLNSKLIICENVRQVLDYVERNEVDAGFVFATDAKVGKNVKAAVFIAEESHEKIIYPISVIKTSPVQKLAQDFTDYVVKSRAVLQKHGFK